MVVDIIVDELLEVGACDEVLHTLVVVDDDEEGRLEMGLAH